MSTNAQASKKNSRDEDPADEITPPAVIYSKPQDHQSADSSADAAAASQNQLDLIDAACAGLGNARIGDPSTSYEAARKAAMGSSRVRPVVLELVQKFGPLTQAELERRYNNQIITDPDTPRSSQSGTRTRLRELVRAGLVVRHEEDGLSDFGNTAARWVALTPTIVAANAMARDIARQIHPDADDLADDQDELAQKLLDTP